MMTKGLFSYFLSENVRIPNLSTPIGKVDQAFHGTVRAGKGRGKCAWKG